MHPANVRLSGGTACAVVVFALVFAVTALAQPAPFGPQGTGVIKILPQDSNNGGISVATPAVAGVPYTFQFGAALGTAPYTWSFETSVMPASSWLNIAADGIVTGTPPASGTAWTSELIHLKVVDSATPPEVEYLMAEIQILAGASELVIRTTSLPCSVEGVDYECEVFASGGTLPYTWALTNAPGWLDIDPATGVLSGTPPAGSATPFQDVEIEVTSAGGGGSATHNILLATEAASTSLNIAQKLGGATTLGTAVEGVAYSMQLEAVGGTGPYTWTSAAAPAWLNISPTGLVTGTPPAGSAGTHIVVPELSDSALGVVAGGLELYVVRGGTDQLTISTHELATGYEGVGYATSIAAENGTAPYSWNLVAAPIWLSLSSSGILNGTPPAASRNDYTFTVELTDSATTPVTVQQTLTLTIDTVVNPLQVTPSDLGNFVPGTPRDVQLTATGGTGPYQWSIDAQTQAALPWLSVDANSGLVSGNPSAQYDGWAWLIHITVTDSSTPPYRLEAPVSLTVDSNPGGGGGVLEMVTTAIDDGVATQAYDFFFEAQGGTTPYTWTITGILPIGVMTTADGYLGGTLTAASAGTYPLTVTVTDDATPPASVTRDLIFTVRTASGGLPVSITTTAIGNATAGAPYSATVAATGGTAPYTWSLAPGAPSWLSINSTTGSLSGTAPSTATTGVNVTVRVFDSTAPSTQANKIFTFDIATAAPPKIGGSGGGGCSVFAGQSSRWPHALLLVLGALLAAAKSARDRSKQRPTLVSNRN